MQKPNLDRMWEAWIRIGYPQGSYQDWFNRVTGIIRSQISELITLLENKKLIEWYQFLIHSKETDPANFYFHLRISLKEGVKPKNLLAALPDYCIDPKPLTRKAVDSISGITQPLLKNEEIEEAWKIIGEQSEWAIHMVNSHKDAGIPIQQFVQFMHYYMNMMGLGHNSKLTLPPFVYSF